MTVEEYENLRVGDKIVCTTNEYSALLTKGKVYKISKTNNNNVMKIVLDNRLSWVLDYSTIDMFNVINKKVGFI